MRNYTNEKFLRHKEDKIKKLISNGEKFFIETFDSLHYLYSLENRLYNTPTLSVFEAVYINNLKLPAWKLANILCLSRTTLFNYRNKIVKNFETYLEKEMALTKGYKL